MDLVRAILVALGLAAPPQQLDCYAFAVPWVNETVTIVPAAGRDAYIQRVEYPTAGSPGEVAGAMCRPPRIMP